jgi:hypothetical protein
MGSQVKKALCALVASLSLLVALPLTATAQPANTLYWQCLPISSAHPNGGYCPVSSKYPLPSQALATTNNKVSAITGTNTGSLTLSTTGNCTVTFAHIIYTASATVGSRYLAMGIYNGATLVADWHAGAAITAGLTNQHIEFLQGVYRETSFINSTLQAPFPYGLVVPAGDSLKISDTAGISASDSFTGNVEYSCNE